MKKHFNLKRLLFLLSVGVFLILTLFMILRETINSKNADEYHYNNVSIDFKNGTLNKFPFTEREHNTHAPSNPSCGPSTPSGYGSNTP